MKKYRRAVVFVPVLFLNVFTWASLSSQAHSAEAWWQKPIERWPSDDYFVDIGGGDYNLPIWMYAALWKVQGFECRGDRSPKGAIFASITCSRPDGKSQIGFQIIFHHAEPNVFFVDSITIDDQRSLTDVEVSYFFHFFRRQIGNGQSVDSAGGHSNR